MSAATPAPLAPTLSALLRRRRGDGPTIRPRPRSRFEGGEGDDALVVVDEERTAPPPTPRAAPHRATAPDAPADVDPAPAPEHGEDPVDGADTSAPGPVRDDSPSIPAPSPAAPHDLPDEPARATSNAATAAAAPPMPAPPPRSRGEAEITSPPTTGQTAPADGPTPTDTAPHVRRPEAGATRVDRPTPTVPATGPGTPVPPTPARSPGRRQAPASVTPPSVEVRIGRLVVDARPRSPTTRVTRSSRTPSVRRPGPDLESYLDGGLT